MPFFKYLDEYSDITDVTFNDRKRFAPLDKFSEIVLRGKSPLSIPEREIIAAFVSGLNECNYCHGTHTEVAKNFGIKESIIEDLLYDIDSADIPKNLNPIMHYVKNLTLTPSRLVKADAQKVFDAGWNEQALYDVICICSLFNFFNRILDGHGIKGNENLYKVGADHLQKNGYGVPWFIRFIKGFIRKSKVKLLKEMEAKTQLA